MKVIWTFNAQPGKNTPFLKACWRVNKHDDPIILLHFYNVHIMNVHYTKFQKSLIVEQFQGNYLNAFSMDCFNLL